MFEINIPDLTTLKYRQILDNARNRTFQESKGTLNDFSRHNPLYVLLSGLAFASTEVLHYANKFAERLALIYLGYIADVPAEDGVKAVTIISVTLTQATIVEIPALTKVQGYNSNGELVTFLTDENLIFDGSEIEKTVTATAENIGSKYSVEPYTLTRLIQPISFVERVENTTQATGYDPKTQSEYIESALKSLRNRSLVAESDFIYWAELAMGQGSLASAIGNLSADKSSGELGSIHVFLLNQNLEPASDTLIKQVESFIYTNSPPMLGTNLYFSPMEVIRIRVEITVEIDTTVTFLETAQRIYNELVSYLSPVNHKPGDQFNIRKFESRLWLLPGIITFEPISVNDDNASLSCTKYQKFTPQYTSCLIIQNDISQEVLIGIGELEENSRTLKGRRWVAQRHNHISRR